MFFHKKTFLFWALIILAFGHIAIPETAIFLNTVRKGSMFRDGNTLNPHIEPLRTAENQTDSQSFRGGFMAIPWLPLAYADRPGEVKTNKPSENTKSLLRGLQKGSSPSSEEIPIQSQRTRSRSQPIPSAGGLKKSSQNQQSTNQYLHPAGLPLSSTETAILVAANGGESTVDPAESESPCRGIKENTEPPAAISQLRRHLNELEDNLQNERDKDGGGDEQTKQKLQKQKRECDEQIAFFESQTQKIEECKTAVKEAGSALTEFTKECSEFSGGKIRCSSAITACEMCPTGENFGEYDCVRIHNQTKCPARSGEDLKTAKEKRDKIDEEIKDLEENIKELEENIVEKENELTQALSEIEEDFLAQTKKLEIETEKEKAILENQLAENKAKISQAVSEAVSSVQSQINKALQISHEFENATSQANRNYRTERRKIIMECEAESRGRLARYRQKRKKAIRSGSLQVSLSELLSKKRRSFASIDSSLLRRYYSQCLKRRSRDFKEVTNAYKQSLRMIEQKQEQYQAQLQTLKQELVRLQQQAGEQENQAVQNYAKNMQRVLSAHQTNYQETLKKYERTKAKLQAQSKNIFVSQRQLSITKQQLLNKEMELTRERELISYLKSKGVKEDMDEMSQAAGALADYAERIHIADNDCNCSTEPINKRECNKVEKYNSHLDDSVQQRYEIEGAGSSGRR